MKSFLFSILLTLALVSFSQNIISKEKYEEGKLYRHQFENGFTVLTIERHIAPLIYHQVTYKVGSRNEKLGITGISHVVEHMMFKGTKRFTKGVVSKTISDNSGIFNAFTANDMTSYYEYMPKNKIEIAFDIESDRMQNAVFDEKEFKPEIEVIKQERRMRSESTSQGIAAEMMNSVAYMSHPNRDPVIGWPSDLDHITRDDAYKYYKTYYTPNNAFMVLVGDFDTDSMLAVVKKYYSHIPAGPEVPQVWAVEEPQKVKKAFTLYHNDIVNKSFRMAFHIPDYTNEDVPALRVAQMILCEKSRGARLYDRMVETDGIASMAAGGFGMSKDPGLFSISVVIKKDSSLEKAEQIVWEEIRKMQTEPVTDKELQKVKNRYKYNEAVSYTKNSDFGTRVSRWETFFGWDFFEVFDNRVKTVTKEDIMRVMNKYFSEEKSTVAYMFPKEGSINRKKSASPDEETSGDEINFDPGRFYFQPPMEALEITASLSLDEKDIIRPRPIKPMIKEFTLDNGIKVYAIEDHLVPEINVIGLFETGIMAEAIEGGKPGIPGLLADLMNRGTETMDYDQLVDRKSFVPFSFGPGGSYKSFSFQGASLIDDADEMMKTGFEIITRPSLKEEELEKIRPDYVSSANDRLKKTSVKAFYDMFNTLFSGHVFTKYNSTEESIQSITKEDLVKLHKKYIRPDLLTMLMVGDMSIEQMKELANKYFGKWKAEGSRPEFTETPPVAEYNGRSIKVFPEKDYTECTINIGFKPFNNIDPDEAEIVSAINTILSGSALTSRMGKELRDKQGLIYGLKSELWAKSDHIGYWKFNTKTGPKNCEKVIKGIFSEIRKFFAEGVTDEELNAAKQRQLGLLPFYVETPGDAATIVFDMITDKTPFDSFDKKAERILSITKEDLLRVAKKYFTLDRFAIVIDGPVEENSLDHLLNEL
jgi:zinc protease